MFKYLFLTIGFCLLFISPVFAQQSATAKKIYQNIEIEKFTIRDKVDFPADKIDELTNNVVSALRKSKRFNQVSLAGENNSVNAESAVTPTLRISGEIVKYVKGNRTARYMIGMGVGKTKILADIKFIDVQTGEVILTQAVDGDVSIGFFGGSSDVAKSEIADEILRVMKKNFVEDKKKK